MSVARGAIVAVLLASGTAVAADEPPASPPPMPSGNTIDEVVVTATSLARLQSEAFRKEEAFYAAFNAANGDHEFDVHCENRTLNSHIQHRSCVGNFVKTLEAEATKALLQGNPPPPTDALIAVKAKLLREKMLDAARLNPDVGAALVDAANARTAFEKETARRCEGRVFFCRRH